MEFNESLRHGAVTLYELEAFLQVSQALNFKKAADALCVTQPALSRRIQSLESKLNAKLFDRTTRSVSLTAHGTELHGIATRIVFEFRSSLSELSSFINGTTGRVQLACLPSVACHLIPSMVSHFVRDNPQIQISIKPDNARTIEESLNSGEIDFGISTLPSNFDNLEVVHRLISDAFVLICSRDHPLHDRGAIALGDLDGLQYISIGGGSSLTPIVESALVEAGVRVQRQFEVGNLTAVGAMVATGVGVALLPVTSMSLIGDARVAVVPLKDPIYRHIDIMKLKQKSMSIASQKFLDFLIDCPLS